MSLLLTIFTATYNRVDLLPRLYKTLKEQTKKEFEWLVIDDGSTDNTMMYMKKIIATEKEFKVRFYQQVHGGKHRAMNKSFDLAEGKYYFPVDSDDWLSDDAVEKIILWINSIENEANFVGVSGLKFHMDKSVVGGESNFGNSEYIDATVFEREKYKLLGDKAEIWLTEACRRHKFPEFDGEYFVTEAVCWEAISSNGGKIRWFNEPIYGCEYLPNGLTCSGANSLAGYKKNYQGYCYYIRQALSYRCGYDYADVLFSYFRNSNKMGISLSAQAKMVEIKLVCYVLRLFMAILRITPSRIVNRIKYVVLRV